MRRLDVWSTIDVSPTMVIMMVMVMVVAGREAA